MSDRSETKQVHMPEQLPQNLSQNLPVNSLQVSLPAVRWLTIHDACHGRKHALAVLASNQVLVNGQPCTAPSQQVSPGDTVSCGGREIQPFASHRHVLLHKPAGCLSGRPAAKRLPGGGSEPDARPTVFDLLKNWELRQAQHETSLNSNARPRRLQRCEGVGRLDLDTTGLFLFSSDGLLASRLLHPDFRIPKLYRAVLRSPEPLSDAAIQKLAAGVQLAGDRAEVVRAICRNIKPPQADREYSMAPRSGSTSGGAVVELSICSGQFHVVKRMLGRVGRPLQTLHRVEFAGLRLSEDLACGDCRELTEAEVAELYAVARGERS